MVYNGIEINEMKLFTNNILFSVLLLITVGLGVYAFFVFRNKENTKSRDRIRRLKMEAETNAGAKKQLDKLERRQKKRIREGLYTKILVFSLIAVLIVTNVFVAVVPGWIDYIKKDYVVYGDDAGEEYEVHRYTRNSTIVLQDGTIVSGALGLEEGIHSEVIVYSKRTKIALGREN